MQRYDPMSPSLKSEIISISDVPLEGRISSHSPQVKAVDSTSARELRSPVVLVVDDEPLVADTLSAILTRAGYSTITAYDGPTALELATDAPPELLISEVAMPQMNGVELALAMVDSIPTCRVLLFSGHATSGDLLHALDAGYDFPLLSKPIHPTEMLKHIARRLMHPARRAASLSLSHSPMLEPA